MKKWPGYFQGKVQGRNCLLLFQYSSTPSVLYNHLLLPTSVEYHSVVYPSSSRHAAAFQDCFNIRPNCFFRLNSISDIKLPGSPSSSAPSLSIACPPSRLTTLFHLKLVRSNSPGCAASYRRHSAYPCRSQGLCGAAQGPAKEIKGKGIQRPRPRPMILSCAASRHFFSSSTYHSRFLIVCLASALLSQILERVIIYLSLHLYLCTLGLRVHWFVLDWIEGKEIRGNDIIPTPLDGTATIAEPDTKTLDADPFSF
ncbi:hypothetical protein BKA64DRAFT_19915 [Cadophora sp. MPI-SDFR-AT-0126]|nr:hypothetical protein BKA64DRAFT_19915 [Leotiomycetes sp. MPI-SDFR-AT-0126]